MLWKETIISFKKWPNYWCILINFFIPYDPPVVLVMCLKISWDWIGLACCLDQNVRHSLFCMKICFQGLSWSLMYFFRQIIHYIFLSLLSRQTVDNCQTFCEPDERCVKHNFWITNTFMTWILPYNDKFNTGF